MLRFGFNDSIFTRLQVSADSDSKHFSTYIREKESARQREIEKRMFAKKNFKKSQRKIWILWYFLCKQLGKLLCIQVSRIHDKFMNRNQRLEKIAWWTQSFPSQFCCAAAMYPPCGWAVNAYWWANYSHVLQLPFILMTPSLKSLKTEFKYPAPFWTTPGTFCCRRRSSRAETILGLIPFGCNYPTNYWCLKHLHIQKVKLLHCFQKGLSLWF